MRNYADVSAYLWVNTFKLCGISTTQLKLNTQSSRSFANKLFLLNIKEIIKRKRSPLWLFHLWYCWISGVEKMCLDLFPQWECWVYGYKYVHMHMLVRYVNVYVWPQFHHLPLYQYMMISQILQKHKHMLPSQETGLEKCSSRFSSIYNLMNLRIQCISCAIFSKKRIVRKYNCKQWFWIFSEKQFTVHITQLLNVSCEACLEFS